MAASARVALAVALMLHSVAAMKLGANRVPHEPRAVTLTLRVAGDGKFRPGETIPIELEFSSAISKRFEVDGATYDRSGRLKLDEFRLEPLESVSDPMLDYFGWLGGSIGGGIRRIGVLGEQPFVVALDLNEWFRFDRPGSYILSVRSRRVTDSVQRTPPPGNVLPVASNTVSFEILPHDRAWEAARLQAALALLDDGRRTVEHRTGCRMLRFLATEAAVDEMIRRYGGDESGCQFEFMAGLFAAPNREHVVSQMEARLRAPDQAITRGYLRTLARLSLYLRQPDLRPPQRREGKGRSLLPGEVERRQGLLEQVQAGYTAILTDALSAKTGRARAITMAERLEALLNDPASTAPGSAALRGHIAGAFLDLPRERQATLLGFQWRNIAGPAMAPVLRQIVDSAGRTDPHLANLALGRLYELAPSEARVRILREIRNPRRGMTLRTLGVLPDRELTELDDVLASSVEGASAFEDRAIRSELVHRYASPAIASRVTASLLEHQPARSWRSQAALLAYLLRADSEAGRTLLDRALTSRTGTGCYRSVLGDVAALRMAPIVEAAAIAHLDDPDVEVVIDAVETLGRHGSPSAAVPLRARFEQWRAVWTGRQEDLRYSPALDRANARRAMLESALLQALGAGQGWLTSLNDLRSLRGFCVTDNCRTLADQLIASADDRRISIIRADGPDEWLISLAQYQFTSIAALERKIAQYPEGTTFTLDGSALDSEAARAIVPALTRFAESRGLHIRR